MTALSDRNAMHFPLILSLIGLAPGFVAADFIDTFPPNATTCCLGETVVEPGITSGHYYGQTFIAPTQPLRDVMFEMRYASGVGPMHFRLLVTTITGPLYFEKPTGVVFESETLELPHNAGSTPFTVNLGALQLQPEERYAFLWDTYVTRDGLPDLGSIRTRADNPYHDGHFIFQGAGHPRKNRDEHWNAPWQSSPGNDVGLRVTLLPGPIPSPLQAGDVNQDYTFDQLDLVEVFLSNKYLTGQSATWGEGDWDGAPGGSPGNPPAGDGVFDQRDIVAALAPNHYLTGPYAALQPNGQEGDATTSLGYNVTTGELWVDAPAGNQLTSINIDSATGIFGSNPAANLSGSFDNDTDRNIFKATFGSSFGSLSFGSVAQPGLNEDFLLDDLTVIGSLTGGGALGDVDLIYVPEPTSLVLLLAAFALLARRRVPIV